jgi:hypothetical protein
MVNGAPLQVANAAMLRLILGTTSGGQIVNVLGVSKPGAVSITQALTNTVGTAVKTSWGTNMGPITPTDVSLIAVGLRDINVLNAPEFLDSGAPVVGTGTGDDLPRATAYVVTLRTALAGQRYRGRIYLGPFTEAHNAAAGVADSTIQTNCLAFVAGIKSALQASGMDLAVLSRPAYATTTTRTTTGDPTGVQTETRNTAARSGAITPVTAIVGRNLIWDAQRRRTSAGSVSTRLVSPDRKVIDFSEPEPVPSTGSRATSR